MDAVVIRPMEPQNARQAAQVWCDGLQQTIDNVAPEKREEMAKFFREYAERECADGGVVGTEGKGLVNYYYHDPNSGEDKDCRMFVAVRGSDDEVLGLVGVKRGMDHVEFPADKTAEDYRLFSIWKMSVAAASQRMGIGKRLMDAVEAWVMQRPDAQAIRLYTANPIAASFYTSPEIGFSVIEKTDHYGIYEKRLMS